MSVTGSQHQSVHESKNSVTVLHVDTPKEWKCDRTFCLTQQYQLRVAQQGKHIWPRLRHENMLRLDVLGSQIKKCIPNLRIDVQYKLFKTKPILQSSEVMSVVQAAHSFCKANRPEAAILGHLIFSGGSSTARSYGQAHDCLSLPINPFKKSSMRPISTCAAPWWRSRDIWWEK